MIQKLKTMILVALSTLSLGAAGAAPALVLSTGLASAAACDNVQNNVLKGVSDSTGDPAGSCTPGANDAEGTLAKVAKEVVKIFSIVVGAVSVIMIIYGGFRYITSGGDSNKVSSAKSTLIYAIIGLVIVALAQFIVHFVISTSVSNVQ